MAAVVVNERDQSGGDLDAPEAVFVRGSEVLDADAVDGGAGLVHAAVRSRSRRA